MLWGKDQWPASRVFNWPSPSLSLRCQTLVSGISREGLGRRRLLKLHRKLYIHTLFDILYIYIRTYIFREQDMQRFQVFHSVSFWGYFNSSFYLLQDGYKKCVYTLFIINHHHFQGLDMGETLHATWLVFWGFAQRPRPSGWAPAPSSWFWRFWLHPGLFGSVGHRRLWELWAQQPGAAWSLPIDRSPLTLQET